MLITSTRVSKKGFTICVSLDSEPPQVIPQNAKEVASSLSNLQMNLPSLCTNSLSASSVVVIYSCYTCQ